MSRTEQMYILALAGINLSDSDIEFKPTISNFTEIKPRSRARSRDDESLWLHGRLE